MNEKEITEMVEQGEAERLGVSVSELKVMRNAAEHAMRECNIQCHLHGEDGPTPPAAIAWDAFEAGFIMGRSVGIDMIVDGLELREAWQEAEHKIAMEREKERIAEIKRRVLERGFNE